MLEISEYAMYDVPQGAPLRHLTKDACMIEVKAYAGLIRNHKELAAELGVDIDGLARAEREKKLIAAAYQAWGDQMGAHLKDRKSVV